MIACYFRIVDQGVPNGYVGMAFAENKTELFWAIDQHCDPYSVEIKTAYYGSACLHREKGEEDEWVDSKVEFCEQMPDPDDDGWRKPNWPQIHGTAKLLWGMLE